MGLDFELDVLHYTFKLLIKILVFLGGLLIKHLQIPLNADHKALHLVVRVCQLGEVEELNLGFYRLGFVLRTTKLVVEVVGATHSTTIKNRLDHS